jgi:predicted enzyme related to lactoylglutathione lyase
MANNNRFVWHDLNTKDVAGAKRFYGEVFNWKFESSDNGPYLHIKAGEQMIGGLREMGAMEPGPSNWLAYLAVDDVAAAEKKIDAADGRVYMPTNTIENVGTFAVTADPTGGVFAPWKSARPEEDKELDGPPANYTFTWDELLTTDPAAAKKFYTQVFGWEAMTMDMGASQYTMFNRPGTKNARGTPRSAGGMMKTPPMVPQSFWLSYVAVENADASCEKAKRFGAKIDAAPQDVPNMGRFATWTDAVGAHLGVFQPVRL